jgi:hypothetical protein
MSWKDLFKSKAARGKPDPRLRWFGKLPTYADYYSSSGDEEWALEFNEWVLKGYEVYVARQREGRSAARLSAAGALRLPKSQMTVFASLQDYGGDMRGRPFPLCFYVGLPTALWPGPTSGRAATALRLLAELTRLRDQVFRFFNAPGRFEAVFGGQELDLAGLDDESDDASWVQTARTLSFADWFAAARECLKVEDAGAWCQQAAAWGASIAKLEGEEFGPTLRFPLVMNMPFDVQVAGWTRWLEQRVDLKRRLLSLIISHDPGAATGRLTVIARDLMPEDFLLATPLAASLPYLDDLCGLRPAATEGSTAGDAPAQQGTRVPEHWSDFVEHAAPA